MKIFSAEYICTQISWSLPSGDRTSVWNWGNYWQQLWDVQSKKENAIRFSGLFYVPFPVPFQKQDGRIFVSPGWCCFYYFFGFWLLLLVPLGWELQLCVPVPCCTKHRLIFNLRWVIAIWFQVNVYLQYKCQ